MSVETGPGELLERLQKLSPKRLALLAAELQRRLSATETPEPIAVIGMACRLPGGVETPEEFWKLLAGGVDAIELVPRDRWDADAVYDPLPATPGKTNTKWGGFVRNIDRFDAGFFGISPREAVGMDPQQRMLIEVAWEALERAGVRAEALNGTATGVFAGLSTSDYASLLWEQPDGAFDAYSGSGVAHSVAVGRLSYFLGLKGPNLAVDTACSSSAVAIHLACQSLRQKECSLALAGGANAMLLPQLTIMLSQAQMLSADGRCKTFAQSADGFVRSEGCGIVVLRRLSDAQAEGDRILGTIRGTSVSHDGRSSGLAAPNGPSQEAAIHGALRQAGLRPSEVDYLEAHGTGTVLGDAIELGALNAVFAEGGLTVGSVKTNIGHLEAAAGVVGLMKVLLSLQHEEIPAHLHAAIGQENEALKLLQIPHRSKPWPRRARPRVAGVNSFGFSGTNVHLVVEEPPHAEEIGKPSVRSTELIAVSAKSPQALESLCQRYAEYLRQRPETQLCDFARTVNAGRSHFAHRIALVASSVQEVVAALAAASVSVERYPAYRFITGYEAPRVAFLFTGQGSQYPGMGKDLYRHSRVFRSAVDRGDEVLRGKLDFSLADLLNGEAKIPSELIHLTAWTQPALFLFEYALASLWISWGIRPSQVLGHSLGEYVAACIAGVLSFEDGLTLAWQRGRLMAALPNDGAMIAVRASETDVAPMVAEFSRVAIAAINGPRSIVLSGDAKQIAQLKDSLAGRGIVAQALNVSHAFHSPLMEPMLDEFEQVTRRVDHHVPQIDLISNLSGTCLGPSERIGADYWRRHVRSTVRFSDGIAALIHRKPAALLEIGPDPVLLGMAKSTLPSDLPTLPSRRRGIDLWSGLYEALRQLYLLGAPIQWEEVYRDSSAQKLDLPTYPFERQRYWISSEKKKTENALGEVRSFDPLLFTTEWEPLVGYGSSLVAQQTILVAPQPPAELFASPRPSVLRLKNGQADNITRLQEYLESTATAPRVVLESTHHSGEIPQAVFDFASELLATLQQIAKGASGTTDVWLILRDTPDGSGELFASMADGMAKTALFEHPQLTIHCMRLPENPSPEDFRQLESLLNQETEERAIRLRNGEVTVARLVRPEATGVLSWRPARFRADGAYLITGGYGGLGLRTAEWMVDRGAKLIFLTGRRSLTADKQHTLDLMRARGAQIIALTGDISQPNHVQQIFAEIEASRLPLRGVIHAAGTIYDSTLLQQSPVHLDKVFAAKVRGSWLLHEATRAMELDFFVLYGSAASTLGSAGQANYAAANGFMDGLAEIRQQLGLPATTIAWGAWSEIGVATQIKDTGRGSRLGMGSISPQKGIEMLEQAMGSGLPRVSVLPVDWPRYLTQFQGSWPFFDRQRMASVGPVATTQPTGVDLKIVLADVPSERRIEAISDVLRSRAAFILRLDSAGALRDDQPFAELGLDSLMAVELKNDLQASSGVSLPVNFFFEFPTVRQAAAYLNAKMAATEDVGRRIQDSAEYEEIEL